MIKPAKWMYKQSLTVLSILPIASVAFAASSRLSEGDLQGVNTDSNSGELANSGPKSNFTTPDFFDPQLTATRRSIFELGEMKKSIEAAFRHFQAIRGELTESEAQIEFTKAVELLRKKGMITVNEKEISSGSPSLGGGGGG